LIGQPKDKALVYRPDRGLRQRLAGLLADIPIQTIPKLGGLLDVEAFEADEIRVRLKPEDALICLKERAGIFAFDHLAILQLTTLDAFAFFLDFAHGFALLCKS
jgi:hypothetical protein